MATSTPQRQDIEPISVEESALARAAQRCIMAALDHPRAASIVLRSEVQETPTVVELPPSALRFIAQLLGTMAEGRAFTLMPGKSELTTVEAANFLNVSRPFVISEIEAGRLHCRKVGSHRRILFEDLQQYLQDMQLRQQEALQRMADNARELGLSY